MTEIYLEKLSAFGRMLRAEGLNVGPKDTEDGARLLAAMDLQNREQVKTALRTVYASSREEQLTFDRVFDGFFLSEDAMRAQAKEQMVKLDDREKQNYQDLPQEARQKLREFLEKYKGNVDRSPHLYGEFIHSVFAKALLEQQMRMENAGLGAEAQDPELGILYRDLGEFTDGEIPKAISMIENLARQLNGELSARRRTSAHSGKLDFRATIRKSLATGGTIHDLKFRKKHPKRKRLVILCDAVFGVCPAVHPVPEPDRGILSGLPVFRIHC